MFDEFKEKLPLRAVYWKDLRPGLVYVGGIGINGGTPPELDAYPVLDSSLVHTLHQRYRLSPLRKVLVLSGDQLYTPLELSSILRRASERLLPLNRLREAVRKMKEEQPGDGGPVRESDWVDGESVLWPFPDEAAGLFDHLERNLSLPDLLSGEAFSLFNFPSDRPFTLHLAVDLSHSMAASGKDPYAWEAAALFSDKVARALPLAEVLVYAFSEECRVFSGTITGREVKRRGTDFGVFIRSVLRRQRLDRSNLLLLFSDGLPDRSAEARRDLERLGRSGIFYGQVVFNMDVDRRLVYEGAEDESLDGYYEGQDQHGVRELSEEEFAERETAYKTGFTELARAASGCQLMVNVNRALGLAAVEVFDRWYGGLQN